MQLNKQLIMALGLAFTVIQTHATDDQKEVEKYEEQERAYELQLENECEGFLADVPGLTPEEREAERQRFHKHIKPIKMEAYSWGIGSDQLQARRDYYLAFLYLLESRQRDFASTLQHSNRVLLYKLNHPENNNDKERAQKEVQSCFDQLSEKEQAQALARIEEYKDEMYTLLKQRCASVGPDNQQACTENGSKCIDQIFKFALNLKEVSNKG